MKDLEKYIAKCEENSVPDEMINTQDIPELTEADFARGHFKNQPQTKKSMTVLLDLDIDNFSWLQTIKNNNSTEAYRTKLNEMIRWARENSCPAMQN